MVHPVSGQRPKALTVRGLIADEVHAPGHVRCLRMAGEQRPQVGVARAGVVAAGDRLAPHGVGDQVGQEPVDFVVCPSMLLLVAKTSCFLNRQDYRLVSAQSGLCPRPGNDLLGSVSGSDTSQFQAFLDD